MGTLGAIPPPGAEWAPVGLSCEAADEFTAELRGARRRVAVLEEMNQAIRELVDRIARLSAFSEGLDRSVAVEDVTRVFFEEMIGILPATVMGLTILDRNDQTFRMTQVLPADRTLALDRELAAQVGSGVFGWALGTRRPSVVEAIHLRGHLILVPVSTARCAVGMLLVGTDLPADAIQQQHLTLAGVVARQAAECIDNLHMAEDVRRQTESLRRAHDTACERRLADLGLLVETAGSVSSALDREAALRCLVESTCRHLGVERAAITVLEPDGTLRVAAGVGLSPESIGQLESPHSVGRLLHWVMDRQVPLAIEDLLSDPRTQEWQLRGRQECRAVLGVPLAARGHVLGVLSVLVEDPRTFGPEEQALLMGLAAQGALAIENARLFAEVQGRVTEQQRAMARLVQSSHLASVGLLTGGVAHAINNPLCIISNHLQLLKLRSAKSAPEIAPPLAAIEKAVERISGSIETLLEYARSRPGERQPTDLNHAIRHLLLLLEYHPVCRRVTVITDLAPGLPRVNLDRAAWEQVLMELVTNAWEAMAGKGRIRIATRRCEGVPEGTAWVEVALEDEGPGIQSEDLARVFDPFFTTKAAKRGMGMGLKIARDIVAEHGGGLDIASDGRTGTRVEIRLPGWTEPEGPAAPVGVGLLATALGAGRCGEE
jgi:signal transduction histidine kinase